MTAVLEDFDVEAEYLLERGKPMPSKNHGYIQSRLSMILGYKYLSEYTL